MATLKDVTDAVTAISDALSTLDLKLDDVKAKIDALTVGQPVTQAQLDELAASVNAVKDEAAKVLAEGSGLAEP